MAPNNSNKLQKESATVTSGSSTGTTSNEGLESNSKIVPMDIDGTSNGMQDQLEAMAIGGSGQAQSDGTRESTSQPIFNGEARQSAPNDFAIIRDEALDSTSNANNQKQNNNSNVPYEFVSSITSDERLQLNAEIERLKLAVFKATITSIGCIQGSSQVTNLSILTRQLETAKKTYDLIFSDENTLVPNETPYFQWRGHHFNKRRPIFATPNDCLDHFELVLKAHRLSINENWERIVPAKLSTGMARWYANIMATQGRLTWSQFRTALINKYGKSIIDTKDEAREQLEKLLYRPTEDFSKQTSKMRIA
ncbi:hypothetical protein BD408DRAFT_482466 [Parasitella parasitica]|nr:hypothetical protein BD408DRAFT_482466 [Parasitella parasitica]